MLFKEPKRVRVNVMMDKDVLETLDAFRQINGASRSHMLNELLRPSLPSLNELIKLHYRMKTDPELDTAAACDTLTAIENKLSGPVSQLPEYIRSIENKNDNEE